MLFPSVDAAGALRSLGFSAGTAGRFSSPASRLISTPRREHQRRLADRDSPPGSRLLGVRLMLPSGGRAAVHTTEVGNATGPKVPQP
jgi:hypothetical protein